MTAATALWTFTLVVGLLTLTPGLDTALVLRTAAVDGRPRAWGVVAGIQSGTLIWGVLTSAGITAVLTASTLAYELLRWAGAAYLVWMGLRMLWGSRPGAPGVAHASEPASVRDGFVAGWRRGVVTNLLNPKVGVFYVSLLPQFVPTGGPAFAWGVLLTCVHIVLGTTWSAVLLASAVRARRVLARPTARRVMDRVAGTVILGFGVRLATSNR